MNDRNDFTSPLELQLSHYNEYYEQEQEHIFTIPETAK